MATYINLDRRTDRRDTIEKELCTLGIQAERFPAIETTPGWVGCAASHLEVLKKARAHSAPYVMVFEDDFEATVSPDVFQATLARFFSDTPDFDVAMLSHNLKQSKPYNDYMVRVLDAQTMSGYIVHHRFYDRLIDLYEHTNKILEKHPHLHYTYACDMAWKVYQPHTDWYAFVPRLGKQRASFSDNTNNYEDYGV